MKILITGGAGYLGSVLVPNLLDSGYEVTVYDNLLYNQLSLLNVCNNKNFNFIYGDVRNYNELVKYIQKSDIIIPLAAIVGFPACEKDKNLATEVNFIQIKNIVDNISKEQRILFPNSNSGYGIGKDEIYCTEESPLNPVSHYGVVKCQAEDYLKNNSEAIIFRLATVFGISPRMRLDLLVNEFVYKALTDRYITIFEKKAVRNYIHIQDIANVFSFMINNYDKCKGEIYNVGLSNANLNKEELVNKIRKHIGEFAVSYSEYYEDPDKRNYIISNEKVESLGWKPEYSLDDGIIELIKGYKVIINNDSSHFRNAFPLGYSKSW
jgi:nucleoside-diphosphate-sugar epimerase|tara:strand:+ start:1596 stop:2564 length:969 start_codon:yes stop_codon:yes gene_type:complete